MVLKTWMFLAFLVIGSTPPSIWAHENETTNTTWTSTSAPPGCVSESSNETGNKPNASSTDSTFSTISLDVPGAASSEGKANTSGVQTTSPSGAPDETLANENPTSSEENANTSGVQTTSPSRAPDETLATENTSSNSAPATNTTTDSSAVTSKTATSEEYTAATTTSSSAATTTTSNAVTTKKSTAPTSTRQYGYGNNDGGIYYQHRECLYKVLEAKGVLFTTNCQKQCYSRRRILPNHTPCLRSLRKRRGMYSGATKMCIIGSCVQGRCQYSGHQVPCRAPKITDYYGYGDVVYYNDYTY